MDLWIESRGLGGAMVHDVGLFAYPGMFFALSFFLSFSFLFQLLCCRREERGKIVGFKIVILTRL